MGRQIKQQQNIQSAYYKTRHSSIHSLIEDLQSNDGLLRQSAREKLVSMGRGVVSALENLVSHKDASLRWEAVKALGHIADPGSVPLFIGALYDKDEDVRWVAAEGLVAIGSHAMRPLLIELI